MPGFEPQTDVQVVIIPIDAHMNATVTEVEATLLVCPDGANFQLEMLSIGYRANVLPADGSAVTVDIETVDDSDGDAVANLVAAYVLTGQTVLVNNSVWVGSYILNPGDAINAEFTTDGSLSTPSEGACFVVEFRVLRHS